MKKVFRKISALLLSLAVIVSCCSVFASADGWDGEFRDLTLGDCFWYVDSDTCTFHFSFPVDNVFDDVSYEDGITLNMKQWFYSEDYYAYFDLYKDYEDDTAYVDADFDLSYIDPYCTYSIRVDSFTLESYDGEIANSEYEWGDYYGYELLCEKRPFMFDLISTVKNIFSFFKNF